jgi:hypothetical protein
MQLDPRSVAVGYRVAKMQMSAELADLRTGIEAELSAKRTKAAIAERQKSPIAIRDRKDRIGLCRAPASVRAATALRHSAVKSGLRGAFSAMRLQPSSTWPSSRSPCYPGLVEAH